MKHRKQFCLIKKNSDLSFQLEGFSQIELPHYTLFFEPSLEVKEPFPGHFVLGDITESFPSGERDLVSPETFLDEFTDSPGRWVMVGEKFLFTDFVQSISLFYQEDLRVIASSLGIIRSVMGEHADRDKKLKACKNTNFPLAPMSELPHIWQLLPGEYICFETEKVKGFGREYFYDDRSLGDDRLMEKMKKQMLDYCSDIMSLRKKKTFLQALTGGLDSRLTLSSFLAFLDKGEDHRTFTHMKPYFFMTKSDREIPKKLSCKFRFKHFYTEGKGQGGKTSFDREDFLEHMGRDVDAQVGSVFYYYTRNQMEPLKDVFFIDNYYETGSSWMKGKGHVGKTPSFKRDDFVKDGYLFNEKGLSHLIRHVNEMAGEMHDPRDILYFVKNFSRVSTTFCELDYYCSPLVHMNSRSFFSSMLSTTTGIRDKNIMLEKLMSRLLPNSLDFPLNQKDPWVKDFLYRLLFKIRRFFSSW